MTTVLYIGGAGRSGSTFLEMLLADAPNCVCAGELRWVWDRGLEQNQLCSCGRPFRECPFWLDVFDEAFQGMDSTAAKSMQDRQRSLDRLRYVPALAISQFRTAAFQRRLLAHAKALEGFYNAISRISNCRVIVDSSKDPTYAYLLAAIPALDFRLLHLVRDSRAVAYSWSRERLRPEIVTHTAYMDRFGPRKVAAIWLQSNLLIGLLRLKKLPSTRLRYEDYSLDLGDAGLALSSLGVDLPAADSPPIGDDAPQWHTVSGNPIRFGPRDRRLRPDTQWKSEMRTPAFMAVTLLTAPVLVRYGYRLRRGPS